MDLSERQRGQQVAGNRQVKTEGCHHHDNVECQYCEDLPDKLYECSVCGEVRSEEKGIVCLDCGVKALKKRGWIR